MFFFIFSAMYSEAIVFGNIVHIQLDICCYHFAVVQHSFV